MSPVSQPSSKTSYDLVPQVQGPFLWVAISTPTQPLCFLPLLCPRAPDCPHAPHESPHGLWNCLGAPSDWPPVEHPAQCKGSSLDTWQLWPHEPPHLHY